MFDNYLHFEVMPQNTEFWVLGTHICPPRLIQRTVIATIKPNTALTWVRSLLLHQQPPPLGTFLLAQDSDSADSDPEAATTFWVESRLS